mmetsp:Transcript_47728/g.156329  ORF Transcript_47728/g.156329 Transcript_47728/m.156329 type:complete len:307 (-) Transcript_47728:312-1232(-)
MMRHGDNPKLAPAAEAALLESLRAEREIKAHEKMQAEAQRLAVTLAALDLRELPAKAKDLSADKKFGELSGHAAMAITLNTILRRVPHKTDGDDKKPKKPAGKPKAGGGAKVTKVVDVPPCTAAEARKVIRANKVSLAAACDGPAAQLALLRAAQAWLLSANGAVALPGAAKVIEVLYDLDLASEGVLHEFWALVGASAQRDATSLLAAKEALAEAEVEEAAAAKAAKAASKKAEKTAPPKSAESPFAAVEVDRCFNVYTNESKLLQLGLASQRAVDASKDEFYGAFFASLRWKLEKEAEAEAEAI